MDGKGHNGTPKPGGRKGLLARLQAYRDGALAPDDVRAVEAELAGEDATRALFDALHREGALLRDAALSVAAIDSPAAWRAVSGGIEAAAAEPWALGTPLRQAALASAGGVDSAALWNRIEAGIGPAEKTSSRATTPVAPSWWDRFFGSFLIPSLVSAGATAAVMWFAVLPRMRPAETPAAAPEVQVAQPGAVPLRRAGGPVPDLPGARKLVLRARNACDIESLAVDRGTALVYQDGPGDTTVLWIDETGQETGAAAAGPAAAEGRAPAQPGPPATAAGVSGRHTGDAATGQPNAETEAF